jgi:hypothetical protein
MKVILELVRDQLAYIQVLLSKPSYFQGNSLSKLDDSFASQLLHLL